MKITITHLLLLCICIPTVAATGVVEARGTEFYLDNNPFYFAGANNYYLFYKPIHLATGVFNDANDINITVMRTWGFCDGNCADAASNSFQNPAGAYPESTYVHFDRIISEASNRGLKLIVPLVNNWDDFGGMCQYVKWCNLPNANVCAADEPWPFGTPTQVHDSFYTSECTKNLYKAYVQNFLNRTNTITGIKYKDDPTIFAWELANEPRSRSDTTTVTLNNWIGEMSAYIQSIDSLHMITPGGDGGYRNKGSDPWAWWYQGNEGQDFIANHQWEHIDFSTFRYYPEPGKFDGVHPATWIQEHISDSHEIIGKPVIMEEFGSTNNTANVLADFYTALEHNGVNGDTLWLLADSTKPGNDGYFVSCPEDIDTCNVISDHGKYMKNLSGASVECSTNLDCDDGNNLTRDICGVNATCRHEICAENWQAKYSTCNTNNQQLKWFVDQNSCDSIVNLPIDNGTILTCDYCEPRWRQYNTLCDGSVSVQYFLDDNTCYERTGLDSDLDGKPSNQTLACLDCVEPYDGMQVNTSTTLCPGTYLLPSGINISGSDIILECKGATIQGNNTKFSSGIYSKENDNVTIKNCTLNNFFWGIQLSSGKRYAEIFDKNEQIEYNITDNSFQNNHIGIILSTISNAALLRNHIENNIYGIYLTHSRWNTISENNVHNNSRSGINLLDHTSYNTVTHNEVSSNSEGITIFNGGEGNTISHNTLFRNTHGIYFKRFKTNSVLARNNKITNNIVSNNEYGIHIEKAADNNFTENTVTNNTLYGVLIEEGWTNNFWKNYFIDNTINALDDWDSKYTSAKYYHEGSSYWNVNTVGNYWSDYDEFSEGCEDINNDNICDLPYTPIVTLQDNFPLIQIPQFFESSSVPSESTSMESAVVATIENNTTYITNTNSTNNTLNTSSEISIQETRQYPDTTRPIVTNITNEEYSANITHALVDLTISNTNTTENTLPNTSAEKLQKDIIQDKNNTTSPASKDTTTDITSEAYIANITQTLVDIITNNTRTTETTTPNISTETLTEETNQNTTHTTAPHTVLNDTIHITNEEQIINITQALVSIITNTTKNTATHTTINETPLEELLQNRASSTTPNGTNETILVTTNTTSNSATSQNSTSSDTTILTNKRSTGRSRSRKISTLLQLPKLVVEESDISKRTTNSIKLAVNKSEEVEVADSEEKTGSADVGQLPASKQNHDPILTSLNSRKTSTVYLDQIFQYIGDLFEWINSLFN